MLTAGDTKLPSPLTKPPFRTWPEAIGEFQQAAAGEELAGVCGVHID
jgi:hypothetical protein